MIGGTGRDWGGGDRRGQWSVGTGRDGMGRGNRATGTAEVSLVGGGQGGMGGGMGGGTAPRERQRSVWSAGMGRDGGGGGRDGMVRVDGWWGGAGFRRE